MKKKCFIGINKLIILKKVGLIHLEKISESKRFISEFQDFMDGTH